jgi:predicted AAA+ superfamily ATPase
MPYLKRVSESKLLEYIAFFSVVALTGPRQSGKSTLLRHLLPDYQYVNFDDLGLRSFFLDDPEAFMSTYRDKVIFDEAQLVPDLFSYIKRAVDADRESPGKFVVSGSSQFTLIERITETLAGRIGMLSLLPFQYAEMPSKLYTQAQFKGSYPELVMKEYALWHDWYGSYLDTYLNRDVRTLAYVGNLRDFQRLMQVLASRVGTVLNMSDIAKDIGIDVKTLKRWMSILEASYVIFLLPPFYENFGKRIIKSPKIYFYDTGIVSFLTGIQTEDQYRFGPLAGFLYENYVIADIMKKHFHLKTHASFYFFRTSHGDEIDLIVDKGDTRDLIEIKSSQTFKSAMIDNLRKYRQEKDIAYLLYQGKSMPHVDVHIMNATEYLKEL